LVDNLVTVALAKGDCMEVISSRQVSRSVHGLVEKGKEWNLR
jgi:hypothetical protein